jgi:tetratricopeptide (TPR) repeat protein
VVGLGNRFRPWWLLFLLGFATLTMGVRFAASDTPLLKRFLEPTPKIQLQKAVGSPGEGECNNPKSTKVDARLGIARDTLRMIRDYPLTGTGAGTYALLYPFYAKSSLMDKTTALHPESDWLMLASECGLPALLVTFVILLILLRGVPSLAVIAGDSWPLQWAFLSAFFAELLHGFVDVPIHRIELGWWVIILGAIGFAVPKEASETKSPCRNVQYVILLLAGAVMLAAGGMMVRAQWLGGGDVPPFESVNGRDRVLMRYAYADNSWYQLDPIFNTCRELVRRYPLQGDIQQQYAIFLVQEKWDLHEAEALFSQARALQPNNADLAYTQGIILAPADAKAAAEIWKDALKRQLVLDALPNAPVRRSAELFSSMLTKSASNPAMLAEMGDLSKVSPEIHASWLLRSTSTAADFEEGVKDQTFLKRLEERDQGRLFEAWWQRGDKKKVEGFLEAHPEYSHAAIATKAAIAASSDGRRRHADP